MRVTNARRMVRVAGVEVRRLVTEAVKAVQAAAKPKGAQVDVTGQKRSTDGNR